MKVCEQFCLNLRINLRISPEEDGPYKIGLVTPSMVYGQSAIPCGHAVAHCSFRYKLTWSKRPNSWKYVHTHGSVFVWKQYAVCCGLYSFFIASSFIETGFLSDFCLVCIFVCCRDEELEGGENNTYCVMLYMILRPLAIRCINFKKIFLYFSMLFVCQWFWRKMKTVFYCVLIHENVYCWLTAFPFRNKYISVLNPVIPWSFCM